MKEGANWQGARGKTYPSQQYRTKDYKLLSNPDVVISGNFVKSRLPE